MKRCPNCKRTFADDTLSFCLDDGTPLVAAVRPDSEETLVLPASSDRGARIPDTQPYNQSTGRSTLAGDLPRRVMAPQYLSVRLQRKGRPSLLGSVRVLLVWLGGIVAGAALRPEASLCT